MNESSGGTSIEKIYGIVRFFYKHKVILQIVYPSKFSRNKVKGKKLEVDLEK